MKNMMKRTNKIGRRRLALVVLAPLFIVFGLLLNLDNTDNIIWHLTRSDKQQRIKTKKLLTNQWTNLRMILNRKTNCLHLRKKSVRRRINREAHAREGNRNRTSSLRIDSWNSVSKQLINKIHLIKSLIDQRKPHILILQEANLWAHHDLKKVQIDGYRLVTSKMYEDHRRKCSRVVVYLKDCVRFRRLHNLELEDFSAIWLEVWLPYQRKIILSGTYREHDHLKLFQEERSYDGDEEQEERWDRFLSKWEEAAEQGKELMVVGDLNVDLMDREEQRDQLQKKLFKQLQQRIQSRGILQLIRGATRYHSRCRPSLIDHVFVTNPEKVEVENLSWGTSDHNLISVRRVNGFIQERPRMTRKRVFVNFTTKEFEKKLSEVNWKEIEEYEEIEEAVTWFDSKFLEILDSLCPIQSIQVRKKYSPWRDDEIKEEEKKLKELKEKVKLSEREEDQQEVHKLARKVRRLYNAAEDKWMKNKVKKNIKNPRLTWKQLNEWAGWQTGGAPSRLRNSKGEIINSPKAVAEEMAAFYENKVMKIRDELKGEGDPCEGLRKIVKVKEEKFCLKPVSEEEVKMSLRKMKSSSSLGPNGMQADLLKKSMKFTVKPLTYLTNLSIKQSKFPNQWKTAKVIPLWKGQGGDKLDPKEYRPVSLLNPVSRLVERMICNQVISFLEEERLLAETIHGYRKGHSCESSVIEMLEEAVESQEEGSYFAVNIYDQSCAFDLLDYSILESKLRVLNFSEETIRWYRSFLQNRRQFEGKDSDKRKMTCGAPQGSSSGPLLWLIYTLDLPAVVEEKEDEVVTDVEHEELLGEDALEPAEPEDMESKGEQLQEQGEPRKLEESESVSGVGGRTVGTMGGNERRGNTKDAEEREGEHEVTEEGKGEESQEKEEPKKLEESESVSGVGGKTVGTLGSNERDENTTDEINSGRGVSVRHGYVPPHPRQSGRGQTDGGVDGGAQGGDRGEGVSVRPGYVPPHPRQSGRGQTDRGEDGGAQGGGKGEGVSVRRGYVPPHPHQSGRGPTDGGVDGGAQGDRRMVGTLGSSERHRGTANDEEGGCCAHRG